MGFSTFPAFFTGIVFMIIYYAFFHPTGIDTKSTFDRICHRKRRTDRVGSTSDSESRRPEIPFLDLRPPEMAGDSGLSGSDGKRPHTPALSASSPCLDDLDPEDDGDLERPRLETVLSRHVGLKRSASVPVRPQLLEVIARRHLKAMSGLQPRRSHRSGGDSDV